MKQARVPAAAAVAVATLMATFTVPAAAAVASSPRQMLSGVRPAWARSTADQGPVAAGKPVSVRVYLAGRDPAGLARYAGQVSEPGRPAYHHYLTPAQFERRFGPTEAQISSVRNWLTGAGLAVTATTRHYVAARGTAASMQTAFGSQLHRYRTSQGSLQAPQSPVTIPARVARAALTVTGLATSRARPSTDLTGLARLRASATPSPINEGPCSRYWGQKTARTLPSAYGHKLPYALCGYTPPQLRSAYGLSGSGLTGKGVTIAIVDQGS